MDGRWFWLLRASIMVCLAGIVVACGGSPATPGQDTAASLEGTEWRLVEYGPEDAPVSALPEPPVTVKFEPGGQLVGYGGCNSYGGTYELDGQSLRMGQIQSTMMACLDAAVTQQESEYLSALGAGTGLRVEGDELVVNYDGGRLRFARVEPAGGAG